MQENTIVLSLDPTDNNGRNSEGAFLTLCDGRIAFVYSKYITKDWTDHAACALAMRESADGGLTWSREDRILVEPGDAINVMSVSLLRLRNGRILLCYLEKRHISGGCVLCRPLICFSDDELQTLSSPFPATQSLGYHIVNNDRIIQLRSGRLVIPVALHRYNIRALAEQNTVSITNPAIIFFLLSDDEGLTWKESTQNFYRCFADGNGFQEPGVVELNDGRIWCWLRCGWRGDESHSHQWQSFSADGGNTWTEPESSNFISPRSPLSLKRIPTTGDLLAAWNDHSGRFPIPNNPDHQDRTPLAAAISVDDGATWHHHQLIENAPDHGYCYTAIHFTDDAVLLGYCSGGPLPQDCLQRLRIRRIPLAEIYNR